MFTEAENVVGEAGVVSLTECQGCTGAPKYNRIVHSIVTPGRPSVSRDVTHWGPDG